MGTVIVLIAAVAVIVLVLNWSGRHGDPNRSAGTSLRRGPGAHTTATGRPKAAFATREQATEHARLMTGRDGVAVSAYQCRTCGKWHVGHS